MGVYVNPGNKGFEQIKTPRYVDKSGLLSVLNSTIGTERRLSCVSRARRFGKSYTAQMLAAYYDASCDSTGLFQNLVISEDDSYQKYLNRYHVIYLDITGFIPETSYEKLPDYLDQLLKRELSKEFPDLALEGALKDILVQITEATGRQFFAIIDEWDAPMRARGTTEEIQYRYLEFLRMLFKSQVTNRIFAGAFMTGILPIKKDGTQSAISEFKEYTMIRPGKFAPFIGFSEKEVKEICNTNNCSFEQMKKWYNGYIFRDGVQRFSIYNSGSVMEAAYEKEFASYWRQTSAVNGLRDYFNLDYDGLGEAAEKLLAGLEIPVRVSGFRNDLLSFESADDVLTLLIHFGYLNYDPLRESVHIPNNEIALEFADMIHGVTHNGTIQRIKDSALLLESIVNGDEEAVADGVQKVHMEESSMKDYNNEQALRAIIKLSLFTYRDHYIQMEELDSGTGYADIVFLPKRFENYPALVVELKYNDAADGAINQIKDRHYPEILKNYGSEILLVGVSYDKTDITKTHHCIIEKWEV